MWICATHFILLPLKLEKNSENWWHNFGHWANIQTNFVKDIWNICKKAICWASHFGTVCVREFLFFNRPPTIPFWTSVLWISVIFKTNCTNITFGWICGCVLFCFIFGCCCFVSVWKLQKRMLSSIKSKKTPSN